MTRAKYMIERTLPDQVVIADIGTSHMSVTNDAEAVVRELYQKGILKAQRLMYYDSTGRLDELKHDGCGRFTGFAPGPEGGQVLIAKMIGGSTHRIKSGTFSEGRLHAVAFCGTKGDVVLNMRATEIKCPACLEIHQRLTRERENLGKKPTARWCDV